MSTDLFSRIVKKIVAESPDQPNIHLYNWGEPFLNASLPRIMDICWKHGIAPHLSSNFMQTPGLQDVVSARPGSLRISLSGSFQETYQRTHRGGNIVTVKENAAKLRAAMNASGISFPVHFCFHRYRHNSEDLVEIQKLAHELGFDVVPIPAYFMPVEKMLGYLRGDASPSDRQLVDLLLVTPNEIQTVGGTYRSQFPDCPLRAQQMVIDFDGSVPLCCAVFSHEHIVAHSFLEHDHKLLQLMKYQRPICGECMEKSVDIGYLQLHQLPEFAAMIDRRLAEYKKGTDSKHESWNTNHIEEACIEDRIQIAAIYRKGDMMLEWTGERYVPWVEDREIHYEHLHRYRFAKDFVRGLKVLDLASGEGYGSFMLAQDAGEVTGVDIDAEAVQHASTKYQRQNLRFIQGSMTSIPISGGPQFDVITCFEALEHIEDHDAMLQEVKRLLKKDGIFIVSTPDKLTYSDKPGYQNPYHVKEIYLDDFKDILGRQFKHTRLYGQKVYPSSNIFPLFPAKGGVREYDIEENGTDFVFTSPDKKAPRYYIALSSDVRIPETTGASYLLDITEPLSAQERKGEPQNSPLPEHIEARKLAQNGAAQKANEIPERLLHTNPTDPSIYTALGTAHFMKGDKEKALEQFKHALHLEPNNTAALRNLADLYFIGFGRLQDAYKIYLKLLDKNPQDVETLLILGNIDALQDNFESAKGYYKKALLLEPGNRNAWENLSLLLKREEKELAGTNYSHEQAFGVIDNPKNGQTVSGELNVYGWVLSKTQKDFDVIVMIDNTRVTGVLRGKRQDVIAAYPDYEQLNSDPGFGFTLNSRQLADGKHTLKFLANVDGTSVPIGEISFKVLNVELSDGAEDLQKMNKPFKEQEELVGLAQEFLFIYKLLPKLTYGEIKYSKIELVSNIGSAESIRDFGGIWGVHGLYLLEGSKNLKCKFAEMIDITPMLEYEENTIKYQETTNCKYNMITADFRNSIIFSSLQDVDVSLLYEVILHQDNAVEVIKNVISKTKKVVCFAQPVMKEELFSLPNACVNLQFYPEQLKDILRFPGWWEKERIVARFDTSCWMWGQTASYIVSIFQGYGWKPAHLELYHMSDYWNYVMARFVPES